MRDTFIRALSLLAERDERIMLLTADLGFGVLDEFQRRFPRQFLNVGVAEQNLTAVATGLALEGHIAFTYSIGNFPIIRCLEQIRNDAAYHQANVKVVAVGGGYSYGALGMSHHATEDLAIMRAIPGLTVVAPGDDYEVESATNALARMHGPCYLRLDRASAASPERPSGDFEIGRGRVLRHGDDVTLVSTGGVLSVVMDAATRLQSDGISARVISLHTLKPVDTSVIRQACLETSAIVTVEEHVREGGLGSAVAEVIVDEGLVPGAVRRIALPGRFESTVGSQDYLRRLHGLTAENIVANVREVLSLGVVSVGRPTPAAGGR